MNSIYKIKLTPNLNLQHCANRKPSRFTAEVMKAWVLVSLLSFT